MIQAAKIDRAMPVLMGICFAIIIVGVLLAFFLAPVEGSLGIVQKIFYFHVPTAFSAYLGFALCTYGSVRYLLRPLPKYDHMARAGAEVGVLFAAMLLITGPLWAYKSWGDFWEWEPRLTSMLLTFLIYTSYLLLRSFGGTGDSARKIGAVMGTVGIVGVLIVRVAVKLWGGVHPQVVTGEGGGLHPDMKPAFLFCSIGFVMLAALLAWMRARLEARKDELEQLHLKASDIEYELEV